MYLVVYYKINYEINRISILMEFSEILQLYSSLFTKQPIYFIPEHSFQTNIMFMKWLSRETDMLETIRPLMDYIFIIKPKSFYYLLYNHIPKREFAPKIKKKDRALNKKEERVLTKVREVLGWSQIELDKNLIIIEEEILSKKRHWEREFGFK